MTSIHPCNYRPRTPPSLSLIGIRAGQYIYIKDLLALEACRPAVPNALKPLQDVSTPLIITAWETSLAKHPDPTFRQFILTGLTHGFRIGFNRTQQLSSAQKNMFSAVKNPTVIEEYLTKERAEQRLIGPLPFPESLHISRFGVIPKGHTPGKWRLITDLSYPPGLSVNDGIDKNLCSMSYITVDMIADIVASFGPASLMAKVDIQSAYRLIPVHPDDRPFLAVQWQGDVFCDAMLPFGLRSAPKLFNAVADALEWCIRQEGVVHVYHYLDDFIVLGPPSSAQCLEDLQSLEAVCTSLGVPLAAHKREGPTTCLTFLGIELDSVAGVLRLPEDKLQRLTTILREWGDRKACTRKELESLIGLLNHACKVVRPGRTFLRRMIDLLTSTGASSIPRQHHHIRLNREFRADLAWWRSFVQQWNGVGLLKHQDLGPGLVVTSDASGSWGCGAWHGTSWFQYAWSQEEYDLDISVKELTPVVLSAAIWGKNWSGRSVSCFCDNQAVVTVLNKRSCRDKHLMHLLRCLFFFEAQGQFRVYAKHISGSCNGKADDLSRNNLDAFFSKVPGASHYPSPVPTPLPSLLLSSDPDWVSPAWTRHFSSILSKV